jgi:hypothetical protein
LGDASADRKWTTKLTGLNGEKLGHWMETLEQGFNEIKPFLETPMK